MNYHKTMNRLQESQSPGEKKLALKLLGARENKWTSIHAYSPEAFFPLTMYIEYDTWHGYMGCPVPLKFWPPWFW